MAQAKTCGRAGRRPGRWPGQGRGGRTRPHLSHHPGVHCRGTSHPASDSEYRRTMFSPLVDVFGDQEVIRLFSEESLVAAWLEFERALADAQAELGVIPSEAAREIAAAAVP